MRVREGGYENLSNSALGVTVGSGFIGAMVNWPRALWNWVVGMLARFTWRIDGLPWFSPWHWLGAGIDLRCPAS